MSDADWREVARAMREDGIKQREIAARLGRNVSAVARALRTDEQRERDNAARRSLFHTSGYNEGLPDELFVDRHNPRTIRKLPGDPFRAARRFGHYEIDLEQLSRELWGRE